MPSSRRSAGSLRCFIFEGYGKIPSERDCPPSPRLYADRQRASEPGAAVSNVLGAAVCRVLGPTTAPHHAASSERRDLPHSLVTDVQRRRRSTAVMITRASPSPVRTSNEPVGVRRAYPGPATATWAARVAAGKT